VGVPPARDGEWLATVLVEGECQRRLKKLAESMSRFRSEVGPPPSTWPEWSTL
jgi:hypothetical protein